MTRGLYIRNNFSSSDEFIKKKIYHFLHLRPEITDLLKIAKEMGNIDQFKIAAYEVSHDQWEELSDIREIYATFEDPTLDLQGLTYSTISLTIPHVHGVFKNPVAALSVRDSNGKDLKKRNHLTRGVHEVKNRILDYCPLNDKNINSLRTLNLECAFYPRF